MIEDPNRKPFSGFRNPLIYTSTLVVLASVYAGGMLYMRKQEKRQIEEKAREQKRVEAKEAYESLGGDKFEILDFYVMPGFIRRGESAQLCYGVSNAKTVKLEPQSGQVWPSTNRCMDVAPKKDRTYTLTVEDGNGNTKTATVVLRVH